MTVRHLVSLGGFGGRIVANRTAVVYISSCLTAIWGRPNLACTISPCSVDLSVPCSVFTQNQITTYVIFYLYIYI